MNWANIGGIATVIAALVAVGTLYITTRNAARERAQRDAAERAALVARARLDGVESRDDEFTQLRASHDAQTALLRSQLGDARRERDRATARADDFERRYNDLRDRST